MSKVTTLPKGSTTLPPSGAFDHLKDKMGRFRTQSLFIEYKHPDYCAPFTLKQYDKDGALSMYRQYMDIGDPTEYGQAIGILGSWKHWEILTATEWFKPHIEEWRKELKIKLESDRFLEMQEIVEKNHGTPGAAAASKWLAERYGSDKKPKRGRPSKAEKAQLLKEESEEEKLLREEHERLGLK